MLRFIICNEFCIINNNNNVLCLVFERHQRALGMMRKRVDKVKLKTRSECAHKNKHKGLCVNVACVVPGADFIKTSTGKEGVNAIFPVALVMVRAIREYFHRTGFKVRERRGGVSGGWVVGVIRPTNRK